MGSDRCDRPAVSLVRRLAPSLCRGRQRVSKISKDEFDRRIMPREPKIPTHGTALDSRILDRMESAISEFRYWSHPNWDDSLPPDYRKQQIASYRAMLRKTAQELLDALAH